MPQSEQGTIMTRLVYKDRNQQRPGSKPGSKPNSKLDKRTSDAMDEIEGPAERDGGAATDHEHPPVEEPKDQCDEKRPIEAPAGAGSSEAGRPACP